MGTRSRSSIRGRRIRASWVLLQSLLLLRRLPSLQVSFPTRSTPFAAASRCRLKPKEQWLYSGTLDCAVKIIKDEGVGAMFKGFAANVLRTLVCALVLVGSNEIKRIIGA